MKFTQKVLETREKREKQKNLKKSKKVIKFYLKRVDGEKKFNFPKRKWDSFIFSTINVGNFHEIL